MGAINPFVKQPGGAVNEYPPPIVVVVGGEKDGVDATGRAGEGVINPFSERSVRRTRSDSKSHANGVVLPPQCGGGGEWDNDSINIRAKLPVYHAKVASIWSNFRDILAWTTENGAIKRYDDVSGADGIGGIAVGQCPPFNFFLEGEYDGVDAANGEGKGAIDPLSKQSRGRAWANGIGSIAVGLYSPPIVLAEGKVHGIDAGSWAGGGAINPFAKQLNGLAWANGIGGAAIGLYSPPMVAEVGGEYFVLPR
jgi:hypothetical protein